MSIAKVLFFAIVFITFLYDYVHTRTFDDDDDYIRLHDSKALHGTWYLIATVTLVPYSESLFCIIQNVTESENYEYVQTYITTIKNGVAFNYEWLMKIEGHNLGLYLYQNGTLRKEDTLRFDLLTDLGLLIMYNVSAVQPITIYSRQNITLLSLSLYANIAKHHNWTIQYVNYALCRVREITQQNIEKNLHGEWPGNHDSCLGRCASDYRPITREWGRKL